MFGDSHSGARIRGQTHFQACRGDDPRTGWSEAPNRNLDAGRSARTATDSLSAHALWSSRKTAGADARVSPRARAGWLHLRHPKFAREIQVRGRI